MSGNIDEADYVKHAAEMQRKFLAAALDARDIDELEEVSAACFAEEAAFVAVSYTHLYCCLSTIRVMSMIIPLKRRIKTVDIRLKDVYKRQVHRC